MMSPAKRLVPVLLVLGTQASIALGAAPAGRKLDEAYVFSSNEELEEAVELWCEDVDTAMATYGNISGWDVSAVTDMEKLFEGKQYLRATSARSANITEERSAPLPSSSSSTKSPPN